MSSNSHHSRASASPPQPNASSPHLHLGPEPELTTHSRRRVRSYSAHALVLFNVYGIPLSSGIWLEYYFTSVHPFTSLLLISTIFGAQLACFGLTIGLAACMHAQWPNSWRLQMVSGLLSVAGAWITLLIQSEEVWVLVLCQGALTGIGLGALGTISTLTLSSHYKHNTALTSTRCTAAGFIGAVVYTVSTWLCLRAGSMRMAYGVSLALLSSTLLTAICMAEKCDMQTAQIPAAYTKSLQQKYSPRTPYPFMLTLFFASTTFIVPLYTPILLSEPSVYRANGGPYTLITLFTFAACTSVLVARRPLSRLSPSTIFIASTFLLGISLVSLIWMRILYVALPCAAIYGGGLGGVCTLWFRVLGEWSEIHERAGNRGVATRTRVCLLGAVGGTGVGVGLAGAAAVFERWEKGVEIVLGVLTGGLVLGGLWVWAGIAFDDIRRRVVEDK